MATTPTRRKAAAKADPFAEVDEPQDTTTNEETNVNDVDIELPTSNEMTMTFKAGTGFDAPWIVVRVPDLDTADSILTDQAELLKSVMEKTARAGVFFASQMPSGAVKGGDGASASAPTGGGGSGRFAGPGGQTRQCKHGDMVFRSGSKNGRTWEAFFCPTAQGTPDQCKAQFL